MIKGVSPLISPELLKVLSEMGHGDEIVLADANFPSESMAKNKNCIRADGIKMPELLEAILQILPLDQYDDNNFVLMQVVRGDPYNPVIWDNYKHILMKYEPSCHLSFMERYDFYDRAKDTYAVVATGEISQYANIILKKGVVKP